MMRVSGPGCQFFDVEWEDSDLYDLVINTEHITVDDGCDLIERLLDSPEFQATEASRQDVRDRALAARVAEALKMDPRSARTDLAIAAHRGVVTLEGLVFSPEAREAAAEVARQTAGVNAVNVAVQVARASRE